MKKTGYIFALIVLLITIAGCTRRIYNRVFTYNDEFRNSSKRIARVRIKGEEKENEINSPEIVFEKVTDDSTGESYSSVYFVISRPSTSFNIESEGFMKAGGQKFKLKVVPATEYRTEVESSSSSLVSADSTGMSSYETSGTSTSNWYDEKFVIDLTPEMITAIRSSNELTYRFYFGSVQATFIIDGMKLKAVQGVYGE
jgi:hypothetical protein